MKQNAQMDSEYLLWLSLIRTSDIIHRARDKELSKYGVSARQAAVLYTVTNLGDDATVGNISKWLFRRPQTVTSILNRMEKARYIKKIRDKRNKSIVRVTITKKGQEVYAVSTERTSIKNIMSALSDNETKALKKLLIKLRDRALEEIRENPEDMFNGAYL